MNNDACTFFVKYCNITQDYPNFMEEMNIEFFYNMKKKYPAIYENIKRYIQQQSQSLIERPLSGDIYEDQQISTTIKMESSIFEKFLYYQKFNGILTAIPSFQIFDIPKYARTSFNGLHRELPKLVILFPDIHDAIRRISTFQKTVFFLINEAFPLDQKSMIKREKCLMRLKFLQSIRNKYNPNKVYSSPSELQNLLETTRNENEKCDDDLYDRSLLFTQYYSPRIVALEIEALQIPNPLVAYHIVILVFQDYYERKRMTRKQLLLESSPFMTPSSIPFLPYLVSGKYYVTLAFYDVSKGIDYWIHTCIKNGLITLNKEIKNEDIVTGVVLDDNDVFTYEEISILDQWKYQQRSVDLWHECITIWYRRINEIVSLLRSDQREYGFNRHVTTQNLTCHLARWQTGSIQGTYYYEKMKNMIHNYELKQRDILSLFTEIEKKKKTLDYEISVFGKSHRTTDFASEILLKIKNLQPILQQCKNDPLSISELKTHFMESLENGFFFYMRLCNDEDHFFGGKCVYYFQEKDCNFEKFLSDTSLEIILNGKNTPHGRFLFTLMSWACKSITLKKEWEHYNILDLFHYDELETKLTFYENTISDML